MNAQPHKNQDRTEMYSPPARSVFRSRTARGCALGLAAIPFLAWLLSLGFNALKFGTPFTASGEWNNFPLWIATMPFNFIAEFVADGLGLFRNDPYALVLVYTAICIVLYGAIGYLAGLGIRVLAGKLKHRGGDREA